MVSKVKSLSELEGLYPLLYQTLDSVAAFQERTVNEMWPNGLDVENADIKLVVDDMELPLFSIFVELQEQNDERIRKEAEQIVEGKITDIVNNVSDLWNETKTTSSRVLSGIIDLFSLINPKSDKD